MSEERTVVACLIIIGNEILSGRTQDRNLAHVAKKLNEVGVLLREVRVIPDVEKTIVDTVNECRTAFDYVFTTGGIGPTHDDITSASVAKAFGKPLVRHPDAVAILEAHYPPGQLTETRLKMAEMPDSGELVDNPVSGAPGYRIDNVFVMAGVPRIMQAMLDGIAPTLAGGKPVLSKAVKGDVAESRMAEDLGAIQDRYPRLDIGCYPHFADGKVSATVVVRGVDETEIDAATALVADVMRALDGNPRPVV